MLNKSSGQAGAADRDGLAVRKPQS